MNVELLNPLNGLTHALVLRAQLQVGVSLIVSVRLTGDQGVNKRASLEAVDGDITLLLNAFASNDEAVIKQWLDTALPDVMAEVTEKEMLQARLQELQSREQGVRRVVAEGGGRGGRGGRGRGRGV